jgi:hypothetical protein
MRATILALLLLCSASAAAEANLEQTRRGFFEEPMFEGQKIEAAFECAALAQPFAREEHERLLRIGYDRGQAWYGALLIRLAESIGGDLESAPWGEKTPFGNARELAAFHLGKLYEALEDEVHDFIMDEHYDRLGWEGAHKQEYHQRNCTLIED